MLSDLSDHKYQMVMPFPTHVLKTMEIYGMELVISLLGVLATEMCLDSHLPLQEM